MGRQKQYRMQRRYGVRPERGSYLKNLGICLGNHKPVDLAGVPQIPDHAHRLLASGLQELPPEIEMETNASIIAAMQELQLRKRESVHAISDTSVSEISEFADIDD